jgi:hypothetical protein
MRSLFVIITFLVIIRSISILASFLIHGIYSIFYDDSIFYLVGIFSSFMLSVFVLSLNFYVVRFNTKKWLILSYFLEAFIFICLQTHFMVKDLARPASLAIYSTLHLEIFVFTGSIIIVFMFFLLKKLVYFVSKKY